jgi:DNA-binding NtrC family response regulator
MITAHGTVDNAAEALKTGALDYITKPLTRRRCRHDRQVGVAHPGPVTEATRPAQAQRQRRSLTSPARALVSSTSTRSSTVADTPTSAVSGESGTGKELWRARYRKPSRRDKPFIKVNCGNRDLMERAVATSARLHRRRAQAHA